MPSNLYWITLFYMLT